LILREIKQRIRDASSIVFFGGAGTSTESRIPDFRTKNGLYQQKYFQGRTPEELLSSTILRQDPETFFRYYREHLVHPHARPNRAHIVLAKWEQESKIKAVITQNIDGLHQMAGSRNVMELHGSVHRNYCIKCGRSATLEEILIQKQTIPRCHYCQGMIRPDVVLYGEGLDQEVMDRSIAVLRQADMLIVGGTSLVVFPAAGLIEYFQGEDMLMINHEPTPYDH